MVFGVYVNVKARGDVNSINAYFTPAQVPPISLTNASEEGKHLVHHNSHKICEIDQGRSLLNGHETSAKKEVVHDGEILENVATEPKRCRLEQMTHTNLQQNSFALKGCNVASEEKKLEDRLNIPQYDQPLYQQEHCKLHMKAFHNSMQPKMYHCTIYKEIWPLREKKRNLAFFICRRCKLDKKEPKKFSSENNMIPSPVPDALLDLSQCEEILISRAFPVIQVYIKSGGSYSYKGHVINLPNNVQHVANVLPHCTKDIPIVAFTIKGKNDFEKEFKVRREKVLNALLWLIQNNPLYANITIDYYRLESLPVDGFINVDTVDFNQEISQQVGDLGPPNSDLFEDDNRSELNVSSLLPENLSPQTEEKVIKQSLDKVISKNSLDVGSQPLDEFKTQFLASLAFPTLFPDAKGDPTNTALQRDIASNDTESFAKKVKHLIKYGDFKNGQPYYRFAAHPRFAYWAFNMLYRKRLLGQGNFYIKQNRQGRLLSVDDFKEMLQSGNYSQVMSKIMHYAKNVSGTNAYWNESKEQLRAMITQKGSPTIFWPCLVLSFIGQNFTTFSAHIAKCLSGKMSSTIPTSWITSSQKE